MRPMKDPNMTDPKPRRFTADEMDKTATAMKVDGWGRIPAMLRQAAQTERERKRIVAALRCTPTRDGFGHALAATNRDYVPASNCPACAIRRAAGLEES